MAFFPYVEDYSYGVVIDDSMLPEALVIEPGSELDILFTINGKSYHQVMNVPLVPTDDSQPFELENDFSVNWSLTADADVQIVSFDAEAWLGSIVDRAFIYDVQVSGDIRSFTFPKNTYSQYTESGFYWFGYGVDTINYKNCGEHMFVTSSEMYIEQYDFKNKEKENKFIKVNKLIKMLKISF
jgi:hypothetical protein